MTDSTVTDTPQTDTALLPLLQRLAELAPEICLYEPVGLGQIHRFRLSGSVSAIIDLVEGQDIAAIDYAVLQWELQEAISARGWYWESTMNDSDDYEADVTDPYTLDPNGCPSITQVAAAKNPAIALLSAFLQTMEAV